MAYDSYCLIIMIVMVLWQKLGIKNSETPACVCKIIFTIISYSNSIYNENKTGNHNYFSI